MRNQNFSVAPDPATITAEIAAANASKRIPKSGLWFPAPRKTTSIALTQAADLLYLAQFSFPFDFVVSEVALTVSTGVAATAALLGIYAHDLATDRPALLLRQGTASVSTATNATAPSTPLTSNLTLLKDQPYWMGTLLNGAPTLVAAAATMVSGDDAGSAAPRTTSAFAVGLRVARTYASGLPADLTGTSWTETISALTPIMQFKAA